MSNRFLTITFVVRADDADELCANGVEFLDAVELVTPDETQFYSVEAGVSATALALGADTHEQP